MNNESFIPVICKPVTKEEMVADSQEIHISKSSYKSLKTSLLKSNFQILTLLLVRTVFTQSSDIEIILMKCNDNFCSVMNDFWVALTLKKVFEILSW